MIEIYLLRHGESEYNLRGDIFGGRSGWISLTETGKMQAGALGKRLKKEGIKFDKVFSSSSKRAVQTAEIICKEIGYPYENLTESNDLSEIFHGEWEGKLKSEVYTRENIERMEKEGWDFKAPGGESQKDVEDRMYSWLAREVLPLDNNEKDCVVAIVTHSMAIKCLIRKITEHSSKITYRTDIRNCSISRFRYKSEEPHKGWSVIKINDDSHLNC